MKLGWIRSCNRTFKKRYTVQTEKIPTLETQDDEIPLGIVKEGAKRRTGGVELGNGEELETEAVGKAGDRVILGVGVELGRDEISCVGADEGGEEGTGHSDELAGPVGGERTAVRVLVLRTARGVEGAMDGGRGALVH